MNLKFFTGLMSPSFIYSLNLLWDIYDSVVLDFRTPLLRSYCCHDWSPLLQSKGCRCQHISVALLGSNMMLWMYFPTPFLSVSLPTYVICLIQLSKYCLLYEWLWTIPSQLDLSDGLPGSIWKKGQAKSKTYMFLPPLATDFLSMSHVTDAPVWPGEIGQNRGKNRDQRNAKETLASSSTVTLIAFLSSSHKTG